MPQNWEELALMISKRDSITYDDAIAAIKATAGDMEEAFMLGNLDLCEALLREDLGLEPDYLDLFIF